MIDLNNPAHIFLLAITFIGWGYLNYYVGKKDDFSIVPWIILWVILSGITVCSLVGIIGRSL